MMYGPMAGALPNGPQVLTAADVGEIASMTSVASLAVEYLLDDADRFAGFAGWISHTEGVIISGGIIERESIAHLGRHLDEMAKTWCDLAQRMRPEAGDQAEPGKI